jgi:hypothetical protein
MARHALLALALLALAATAAGAATKQDLVRLYFLFLGKKGKTDPRAACGALLSHTPSPAFSPCHRLSITHAQEVEKTFWNKVRGERGRGQGRRRGRAGSFAG